MERREFKVEATREALVKANTIIREHPRGYLLHKICKDNISTKDLILKRYFFKDVSTAEGTVPIPLVTLFMAIAQEHVTNELIDMIIDQLEMEYEFE